MSNGRTKTDPAITTAKLRSPEHRVLWTTRTREPLPARFAVLKCFFVSYARQHFRKFPWRNHKTTPFELLIAELLLAQTKAEDVERVWPILIRRYPRPKDLARARIS